MRLPVFALVVGLAGCATHPPLGIMWTSISTAERGQVLAYSPTRASCESMRAGVLSTAPAVVTVGECEKFAVAPYAGAVPEPLGAFWVMAVGSDYVIGSSERMVCLALRGEYQRIMKAVGECELVVAVPLR